MSNDSFKFASEHPNTIFLMDDADLQFRCGQEISNYKSLHRDPILLSNCVTTMTIGWVGNAPEAPAGLMRLL